MPITNSRLRALLTSAALTAALALAGCQTDGLQVSTRSMKPLSPELVSLIEQKGMPKESPILVRIFKQEAELEVWKQDNAGRYALLKTYPICRWSGELGPKIREGDRQAPEGFYTITPAQMNPNSQFYLAFNLGYPNAFDKAHGRTGAHLMVHGDCSSRGCYAMTDDQISDIYALGRESFFGGQRAFQVQAYPFRMTAANLAKHRGNPHMPFWRMLKEGNDHFEVTRLEPKVDVCEKRYVFNAEPPANATPVTRFSPGPWGSVQARSSPASLKFNAAGRCPAFQVDPDIASAVAEKKQRDEMQFAELVRRGTPVAPVRTGVDGGMHPTFLAKLKPTEVRDADGTVRLVVDEGSSKPLGAYVNPPRQADEPALAAVASTPARETTASVPSSPSQRSALAATEARPAARASAGGGNMFTRLFSSDGPEKPASEGALGRVTSSVGRLFGSGDDGKNDSRAAPARAAAQPSVRPASARPAPTSAPSRPAQTPAQQSPAQQAQSPPQSQGQMQALQAQPDPAPRSSSANSSLMTGAQPTVPVGSFDSRWGALR